MDKEPRLGHLALEAPKHEIKIFTNIIDTDMIGFGQATQIGKYSCRALEAARHDINSFMKRIDKEFIGVGLGTQIGKSSIGMISSLDGRYSIELTGLEWIDWIGTDWMDYWTG